MDPKLTILFMLVATIIVLSHLGEQNLGRMRRQWIGERWRKFASLRRQS